MATLFVHHKAKDYEAWRKVFDASTAMRTGYGCTGHQVFQSPGDPNEITVLTEWHNIDQAKSYEIVRVGRAVTFVVGALSSTSTIASIISIVTAIPTRFRPGKLTYQSARIIDGSSNVDGYVRAQTTGVIEIGVGSTFSNFQNSGNAGWHGLSITWII